MAGCWRCGDATTSGQLCGPFPPLCRRCFLNLKCLSPLSLTTLLTHQRTLPLTCDKRAVLESYGLEFKP